jgi:hypothetical protein
VFSKELIGHLKPKAPRRIKKSNSKIKGWHPTKD